MPQPLPLHAYVLCFIKSSATPEHPRTGANLERFFEETLRLDASYIRLFAEIRLLADAIPARLRDRKLLHLRVR